MGDWYEGDATVGGVRIHYHRTGGDGKPPLLLLHGLSDNGLCWSRVARDLEDEYDVIMPDARGHGRSDRITDGFSIDMLASDAWGLIEELGLGRTAVFGHSMGAVTAAVLAANRPDLVRAVVLEDPPLRDNLPPAPPPSQEGQARWFEEQRAMDRHERLVEAAHQQPNWAPAEIEPWSDSKLEFDPNVYRYMGTFRDLAWRDVLSRIACPVLLLTGDPELGAIVTAEIAEEAALLPTRGRVAHISGAGHCIHRDRYTESMDEVRAFLQSA